MLIIGIIILAIFFQKDILDFTKKLIIFLFISFFGTNLLLLSTDTLFSFTLNIHLYFYLSIGITIFLTLHFSKKRDPEKAKANNTVIGLALLVSTLYVLIFAAKPYNGHDLLAYIPYMRDMVETGYIHNGRWYLGEIPPQTFFDQYQTTSFWRMIASYSAVTRVDVADALFIHFTFLKAFVISILFLSKIKKESWLILIPLIIILDGRWIYGVIGGTWVTIIFVWLLFSQRSEDDDEYKLQWVFPIIMMALSKSSILPLLIYSSYLLISDHKVNKSFWYSSIGVSLVTGQPLIILAFIILTVLHRIDIDFGKIFEKHLKVILIGVTLASITAYVAYKRIDSGILWWFKHSFEGYIDQLNFSHSFSIILLISMFAYAHKKNNTEIEIYKLFVFWSPVILITGFVLTGEHGGSSRYLIALVSCLIFVAINNMELFVGAWNSFNSKVVYMIAGVLFLNTDIHWYGAYKLQSDYDKKIANEIELVVEKGSTIGLYFGETTIRYYLGNYRFYNTRTFNKGSFDTAYYNFHYEEKCEEAYNFFISNDIDYIFSGIINNLPCTDKYVEHILDPHFAIYKVKKTA